MPRLADQNSHWFGNINPQSSKYRKAYFKVWENLELKINMMSFLIGPRRVGKSVTLKQIVSNLILTKNIEPTQILYWEFSPSDSVDVLEEVLEEYLNTIRNPGQTTYLLLDEIQYLKNWEGVIKLLYDQKPEVKIVLTGSLSLSFKRRMQESLAGRFLPIYIYQMDFKEYLDFTDNPALAQLKESKPVIKAQVAEYLLPEFHNFLKIGRYPATLHLTGEQTKEYITSIEYQTINQDTLNYFNIEKINVFQGIFNYYKNNSGGEVSYQKLAGQIGFTSGETVAKYTDILELLRLIYIIPNSDNPLKSLNSNKKIYTNSAFTLNDNPASIEENLGLAVESYVLEMLVQSYQQVTYFRERQREIDFIAWHNFKEGNRLYSGKSFEVKYQKNIQWAKDTKNLLKISKKLNLKPGLITRNLLDTENFEINATPAILF